MVKRAPTVTHRTVHTEQMGILAEVSALGLFGTGLSQHSRLVALASAEDRALPESLMAEKFSGREAVNELFAFDVDALSVSTDLDVDLFIGEELTVALLQPKHKLVLFDSKAQAPAMPGGDTIRFHGVRATDTDDAIDEFRARRQVQANAVSISSWDPFQLVAPAAEHESSLEAGELPALAIYDGSGERIASDSGVADSHSALMLQALELDNKVFVGAGAVRRGLAVHTAHRHGSAGRFHRRRHGPPRRRRAAVHRIGCAALRGRHRFRCQPCRRAVRDPQP